MASEQFDLKKQRILQQLSVPAAEYTDASPKGSVDEPIRTLVDRINRIANLVTTSSCSGRLSVYVEGRGKSCESSPEAVNDRAQRSTGKGGGRWTFVSHTPVKSTQTTSSNARSFHELFGLQTRSTVESVTSTAHQRFIHLKFEPMILHILTAALVDAQMVLGAALAAGFRESGAVSLGALPIVAVRTNGLSFDTIIGQADDDGQQLSMVSEQYLSTLVALANDRFQVNSERIKRFEESVMQAFAPISPSHKREHPETRRARNREQGLLRQARVHAGIDGCEVTEPPSANAPANDHTSSEDFDFHLLGSS